MRIIWWQSFGRPIASYCLKPWKTSFYINIKSIAMSTWHHQVEHKHGWLGQNMKYNMILTFFSWFNMTIKSGLSILKWLERSLCKLSKSSNHQFKEKTQNIGLPFLLAWGLSVFFINSLMELITCNVMKCLPLESPRWTWYSTILFLLLMRFLEIKSDGHKVKIYLGWL